MTNHQKVFLDFRARLKYAYTHPDAAIIASLSLFPSAIVAQDYDAGGKAYSAGDYQTALKEWRPLAEQGDAKAQYNLGIMYYYSQGVTQDYAEAFKWYTQAAEQGDAKAQYNLGMMSYEGKGVTQDYAEAFKWYTQAAEQGYAKAQNHLGIMYYYSEGVTQDDLLAHMWANLASANGNENSGKFRDHIATKMTPSDISKAKAMARECLESELCARIKRPAYSNGPRVLGK